jgi:hypothetical protein
MNASRRQSFWKNTASAAAKKLDQRKCGKGATSEAAEKRYLKPGFSGWF